MTRLPRLAEVHCTRIRFDPGDRIIVDVYHPLDKDERKKLIRTILKWAGVEIEVLIVNRMRMEVKIEKPKLILKNKRGIS